MVMFDKVTNLSLLVRFILSARLSYRSDILLFPEFITIVSILYYSFMEFFILLYTFLVTFFARHKECMVCLVSFSKFSGVLPAFTCTRISNL